MQQGHEEGGMQCGEKFERHSGNKNAKDEEISGHKWVNFIGARERENSKIGQVVEPKGGKNKKNGQ